MNTPAPHAEGAGAADIVVRPLTPSRWRDLEALFNARGCSVARGCWCMHYRESGRTAVAPGQSATAARHERLQALAQGRQPPGLIAYRGRQPVGWVSLGPREDFARLAHSPVMKPVDDERVWSIVCFVVPPQFRRQGVAHALLAGALAYAARRRVRLLEAYPVDKARRSHDDSMWFGALSMYERAGFAEVARRKPARPVVRLALAAAAPRAPARRGAPA